MGIGKQINEKMAKKEEWKKRWKEYADRCEEILGEYYCFEEEKIEYEGSLELSQLQYYADKVAKKCRELDYFYTCNEAALYSVKGLREWNEQIREFRKKVEEDCVKVGQEDMKALFINTISCINKNM